MDAGIKGPKADETLTDKLKSSFRAGVPSRGASGCLGSVCVWGGGRGRGKGELIIEAKVGGAVFLC